MSAYRKALAALAGAALAFFATAYTDNAIEPGELAQMAFVALTAFATYLVPNAPGFKYAKLITSAALTGIGLLSGWLASGEEITDSMWVVLVIQVGTVLGIFVTPNEPEPAVPPTAQQHAG